MREAIRVSILIFLIQLSAPAIGQGSTCYPEGTEFFLAGADHIPAGCVYASFYPKPELCGAWPVQSGKFCDICINPESLLPNTSNEGLIATGAWGFFQSKWKSARPPVDLGCFKGYAGFVDNPPKLKAECADPFPLPALANACFRFDEKDDFGEVRECFGGGAGQLVNASPVPMEPLDRPRVIGRVGRGMSFEGDLYIEVPSQEASFDVGTENFSLEGWIRVSPSDGVQTIVDKRVGPQESPSLLSAKFLGYSLYLHDGRLGLQIADGQVVGSGPTAMTFTNYTTQANLGLPPYRDLWTHFAVTVERGKAFGIKAYLNGMRKGMVDQLGRQGSLVNSAPLRLGASYFNNSPDTRFDGSLDELTIYYEVLTQPQIDAIYRAGTFGKCFF
jgi:hypothetical protein